MLQNKPLSLSDLIRDPGAIAEDLDDIRSADDIGDDIEYVKEYGIGIDCHSKFIEVCVRYHSGSGIRKAQAHFSTNWDDLVAARDWCFDVLRTKADPTPDLSVPLHYLVESTAN